VVTARIVRVCTAKIWIRHVGRIKEIITTRLNPCFPPEHQVEERGCEFHCRETAMNYSPDRPLHEEITLSMRSNA